MATTNVLTTRTGTGWTVDVTLVNLLPDLSIKDFVILINGSVANNADFTKTSQTVLTYNGVALASNSTVEVRRATPTVPYQTITYARRFSSQDYNAEVDRLYRNLEEYELNGVGPGSVITNTNPVNDAFGLSWDGDTLRPASRNALYDDLILRPYNANPTLTGNVGVPTRATSDNTANAASTAYVKSNLTSYAPLASPAFTGTPTAPSPAVTDATTKLATTYWVQQEGNARLRAIVGNGAANQALTNNGFTHVNWTLGHYNPYSEIGGNIYGVPATGIYRLTATVAMSGVSGRCMAEFYPTSGSVTYGASRIFDGVSDAPGNAAGEFTATGSADMSLTAGTQIGLRVFVSTTGTPVIAGNITFLTVERLSIG